MEITAYCHRLAVFAAMKPHQVLTKKIAMVMKLTAIILLAACLQLSARGVSQTLTLTLKNASLEKVFAEIQKQTGYSFFYEDGLLKKSKPVDIVVVKASIIQVLDMCFASQPFTYKIVNNAISVRKKEQIVEVSFKPETGDPVTVNGKVTDPQGNPLVGANVKVKGSNVGTTTDNLGRFSLSNIDPEAILEISYVDHDPQTFHIKGKTFFTIALSQKQTELDEAVIIAYGKTSRRFTTGNIATLKAADIEKQPVQNPLLALQGRVTGIEVTQLTGLNGGGVRVRIQGINSIKSGLDPLVVVDGVPYPTQLVGAGLLEAALQGGSPLNYINPADIESIDVLKDADATAIYGSRAANGAILITTKKGKAGRNKLNLNLQQGWGKVMRKVDMLNTRQYLDMRYEAYRNDGIIWTAPTFTANDLKVWDTTRFTDWQKELIGRTAKYTNVNATISGGTTAVQYLVGATYNRQTTVFPGDFDDKAGSMNFNLTSGTANQRLKIQLSGNYRYDQNRMPGIDLTQKALLLEPNAPALYNQDGTLNWAPDASGKSTWTNPLAATVSAEFSNVSKNLVSNLILSYRLLNGLEFRSSIGYTNLQSLIYQLQRLESFAPEVRPTAQRSTAMGNRNMSSWIAEPMLQYNGHIGKGKIDALLGSTIQKTSFTFLGILSTGFDADILMKTMSAARSNTIVSSITGISRYNALFGRLSYNLKDKYLLNLTVRRDGSNKFGDKNKFNNFGSLGMGWILSEEEWLRKQLNFLSFAKLRSSYGITGNDQIPDFSYLSIYGINNPTVLYQNRISLEARNIPNPYLQWERTAKWQSGVDLGVFHDRILIGITYARNRSSNQLIDYNIPSYSGFQTIVKNLPATVQNTSWEFTLNTINIRSRNFNWVTSANLTIPRNRLIKFPGIEFTSYADGTQGVVVGQPLGVKKVYHYAGINPANGNYLGLDANGNPNIDIPNRNIFIAAISNWYGGLVNSFTFKKFQLEVIVQVVRKRSTRDFEWSNGVTTPGRFGNGTGNQPVAVLNRWRKPGDDAMVPGFTTGILANSVTASDAWYTLDASYVRLKNLSMSWQLPDPLLRKLHIQNLLIYLRAQNLGVITRYKGIDPESGATGLPPLQLITAGATIEL
ncbi:hypothetical protein A3860_36540 [Niastella vici]|uniref:TonB-dependent receptor plug domain-containing protein n=2 Tax=Niastella vici TaxID=1703345 RepID=A0A1V9FN26_9BACT|nr:hypothetical protein A3860_36540 [Niastella vici]